MKAKIIKKLNEFRSWAFLVLFLIDVIVPTPEDAVPIFGWLDELILFLPTVYSFSVPAGKFMEKRR